MSDICNVSRIKMNGKYEMFRLRMIEHGVSCAKVESCF